MKARTGWWEWSFVALLLAACATLAALQLQWTGELSRAEYGRLRAGAHDHLTQLAGVCDRELRQRAAEFLPDGDAVARLGWQRANVERWQRARQSADRPLFQRVAVAVPITPDALSLWETAADGTSGQVVAWPQAPDWQYLRGRLESRLKDEPLRGPMVEPGSALIEIPVFQGDREREWLILEVDTAYLTKVWLPELARVYLGEFRLDARPGGVADTEPLSPAPDAEVRFFPASVFPTSVFPAGLRGPGRRAEQGRWILAATRTAGSLDAVVEASRRRNLAVSLAPLLLIAGAGFALLRYTRRAKQLADAQLQFVAGVSHELKTPLTVIHAAGHNLLNGVVKDEAQRENYARAIVKHSGQLTEMVDQLLSYSAVRHGRAPAPVGPVSLAEVLSDAIEFAALELEENQRTVDLDIPPTLPLVEGEASALRRVFWNLFGNSIRHGRGEILVTASEKGSVVEVRVVDAGPGIPPDEISRVFEPFFRGSQARTGRMRGAGLGLSLVKETVEGMGGSVAVEGKAGGGTAVIVCLKVHA